MTILSLLLPTDREIINGKKDSENKNNNDEKNNVKNENINNNVLKIEKNKNPLKDEKNGVSSNNNRNTYNNDHIDSLDTKDNAFLDTNIKNKNNDFNNDINNNNNLKESNEGVNNKDHINFINQNKEDHLIDNNNVNNNLKHDVDSIVAKNTDDPFYNTNSFNNPHNILTDNNNNNFDTNKKMAKKIVPLPGPFVDPNVRKDVEFNYGVNYYALRASADSRFLIRYAPPFEVGTPWPRPQLYNSSQSLYLVDPDIEIITHLPQSHQARAKRSFKDFDNNVDETPEDMGNLNHHTDKDNAELKYVPLFNNAKPRKSKKGKKSENDDDFDEECSVLRESIRRIRTITFGGHWDPEEGLVDGDDDDVSDGVDNDASNKGGDWEWNGGKRVKERMVGLAGGVVLKKMEIIIEKQCQHYPHLEMDESCWYHYHDLAIIIYLYIFIFILFSYINFISIIMSFGIFSIIL